MQPIRVLDSGDGIGHALHNGRDGDYLLDGTPQSFDVVLPVQDGPDVVVI